LPVEITLLVFSILIGLALGSFFGCCVYRIPREISLLKPAFSYCPTCQKSIAWYYNIPVFGWLWLRGRCHECGERISARYFLIEAITAVFFTIAFCRFGFPLAIPIWVFGSLLILTTFIDIEFFLIPDLLSKPAIVVGIGFSLLFPELHATSSRLMAAGSSIAGALIGGGALFLMGELGKLAFGRYKVILSAPARFSFEMVSPDDACILIDDKPFRWEDHFFRKKDRIRIHAEEVTINGEAFLGIDLTFYYDRLETVHGVVALTDLRSAVGRTAHAEFPREAMGLGDVKLIAAIGAFTGWPGVLFTIPAASVVGAIYGLGTMLIGRREWSSKIPFGPYLAIGAIFWIFFGKEFLAWYQHLAPFG
jgi:leader peptidase (prepilin peptidase)/N-methyltransferase